MPYSSPILVYLFNPPASQEMPQQNKVLKVFSKTGNASIKDGNASKKWKRSKKRKHLNFKYQETP